jgi:hypothetical protein
MRGLMHVAFERGALFWTGVSTSAIKSTRECVLPLLLRAVFAERFAEVVAVFFFFSRAGPPKRAVGPGPAWVHRILRDNRWEGAPFRALEVMPASYNARTNLVRILKRGFSVLRTRPAQRARSLWRGMPIVAWLRNLTSGHVLFFCTPPAGGVGASGSTGCVRARPCVRYGCACLSVRIAAWSSASGVRGTQTLAGIPAGACTTTN